MRPTSPLMGLLPANRGKKLPVGLKKAAALATTLLVAGVALLALRVAPRKADNEGIWKGYRVLLVDAALPETDVLSALAAGGFKTVVSESTEPLCVSNWVEVETTTLGEARARLVPDDPRRDPYIESLAAWFEAKVDGRPYRVFYIPSSSALFPSRRLRAALATYVGQYYLPDSGNDGRASGTGWFPSFVLAALLLVLASAWGAGKWRARAGAHCLERFALRLAVSAPWIVAARAGLPLSAIAALWGLAIIDAARCLDLPFEEYRITGSLNSAFDSLKRQARPPFALALSAILAIVLSPETLASVALSFLGSSLALIAYVLLSVEFIRPNQRTRFVPKPIASIRGNSARVTSCWMALFACGAVAIWLTAYIPSRGIDGGSSIESSVYPSPVPLEGSAKPSSSELRSRLAKPQGDLLPNLGDWLEHIAFQEALPLERLGSTRSDPFASVTILSPGGKVATLDFDDTWARSTYRSIPPVSIEDMLAHQGRAVGAAPRGGKGRPLAPIDALRYIVLLIPALGRIAARLLASRGSSTNETRQEV